MVVGNSEYEETAWAELAPCHTDATSMAELLVQDAGFRAEDVRVMLDASVDDMREAVDQACASLQSGDTLVCFFSGHGVDVAGHTCMLGVDAPAPGSQTDLQDTACSMTIGEVVDLVRQRIVDAARVAPIKAVTAVVLVDCCRGDHTGAPLHTGTLAS